ncbi:hypothetical protein [Variovorax sp. OV700]|uniref:hypothetical protein n=1 Tax=Variovorax sp. OV700 TaxID=1882826 RepID=UPI00088501AC|nr:hypothetical protein [Variovorax sp. OV700]SDJ59202.1 hypothetical protein SAMN05444748_11653 [Variovorax sp. OV700]
MTISTVFDHFRAVKAWTSRHKADAQLDMNNLQLEVRCANRYFSFYPLFAATINGQLAHVPSLSESVVAFGGWRPYRTYVFALSTDKLLFKQHLAEVGLKTPQTWGPAEVPTRSYITKRSQGSFGYGITGPFRAGERPPTAAAPADKAGTVFAEEFVAGKIVKLWLWGAKAIFADVQEYAHITGDGVTSAGELARQKIHGDSGANVLADDSIVQACLALQGIARDDVPAGGRSLWIDFRYGRTFLSRQGRGRTANALPALQAQCGSQLGALQHAVAKALRQVAAVPLACSVDGVLDAHGQLWWLELNSNPLFPHYGYDAMLSDLFDRPAVEALSVGSGGRA